MKKQIIFLWGWTAKENYKNFLDFLQNYYEFDPYAEEKKRWSKTLAKDLWDNFEIIEIPRINKYFADYSEQKIIFEKVIPFLKPNCILIWHSLGWSFFIKYLLENKFDFPITHIFLLAAAFKDGENEKIWTFNFDPKDKKNIENLEEKITFLHSKDDFVVDFSDFLNFKKYFPKANFIEFENKNHFLDEKFDEFLNILKNF